MTKWFENRLKKVMEHCNYPEGLVKADKCDKAGKWSPCDLIAREYLNNGGGSAKGFLGITTSECCKCYDYMCENKHELVEGGYVSKKAWNNSGYPLWDDYNFDR